MTARREAPDAPDRASRTRSDPALRLRADLAAAVALLTRLPAHAEAERAGSWTFGVVGAVLGLALAAPVVLLGPVAPLAAAVLGLAALTIASGALHLDGLADTADALAAPTPDAAERARQDPRAGAAGVVAIVLALALDATLIGALVERSGAFGAALVAIAATGAARATAPVAARIVRDRVRPGFGRWFADRTSTADALIAAGSVLALTAAVWAAGAGLGPLVAALGALAAGSLATTAIAHLRDGLDGDAFGAVVEIAFAGGLLAALVASVLVG